MSRRDYIVITTILSFYAAIIGLVVYRNQPQPQADEIPEFADAAPVYPW